MLLLQAKDGIEDIGVTGVQIFCPSRRRHTRYWRYWSSDVCSSDLKQMMEFEVRHWMSNHEAGIAEGGRDSNTIGNVFYGSKGYLAIAGYNKYTTFLGKNGEPGPTMSKGGSHFANFFEAVRNRKKETLSAEIEEGAASTVLVHLA